MNPKPLRWEWASAKQAAAFKHPEDRPLLLVGGQGSGKTVVNCRKIIAYLLKYPRSRFLIVRRVFKQLQRTVAKTFYSELPPQYIKTQNKSDGSCVLLNDSEVIFLHLEQEASVSALLSLEINGVFLNECVEIDEKHVDMVQRRLGRWTKAEVPHAGPDWKWRTAEGKPIPPPMFLADSNPDDGDDQHWMVKRFYEDNPARHDKTIPEVGKDGLPTGRMLSYKDLGYDLIEMPSYENRFLPLENLQQLYASGEIERFVEGKRGSRRGKIHIIHPDSLVPGSEAVLNQIRMRCRLSRVLDHGTTAPTCCTWWGADADQNIYCFREYYQADKLISYHRDAIFEHSRQEQYVENLADPSIFAKTMRRNNENRCTWSVADEYMDRGMYKAQTAIPWTRAENTELGTRNRINEYLRFDEGHVNPFTNKRGSPRIFFILQGPGYPLGCVHVHREMALQRHVEEADGTFSTERDPDVVDHAYDCIAGFTLVETPTGQVRIDQLSPSGEVITPHGVRAYSDCMRYKMDSPVVRVELEDGRDLVCTPDHRLATERGWVRADEAEGLRCMILSESPTPSKSGTATGTTSAATTSNATGAGFTEWCGRWLTDLSRWGITSTTSTATAQTTGSPTSLLSMGAIISRTTPRESLMRRLWQRCRLLLRSGIGLRLAALGIASTPNGHSVGFTFGTLSGSVSDAEPTTSLRPRLRNGHGSAGQRASRRRFTRVTRVTSEGSTDTWCLTVRGGPSAFAVNGGLVVSNCARYYIAARTPVKFAKPGYPKGSIGYDILENERRQRQLDRAEVSYGL